MFNPRPGIIATDAGIKLTASADDRRYAIDTGGEPIQSSETIAEIRFQLDAPPWEPGPDFAMDPADGDFDAVVEDGEALIDGGVFGTERRLVHVYAIDAAGNQGPPTALFVQLPEVIVSSGFE